MKLHHQKNLKLVGVNAVKLRFREVNYMKYAIAKLNAQKFANEKCKPVYISRADNKNGFQVIFDNLELTTHYSIIETVLPSTKEYLQLVVNSKVEDVISGIRSLPCYTINEQPNYFNASDVMDIVLQLRKLQK